MNKRRKTIKGSEDRKIVFPKLARYFSHAEKELVIQEYLTTSSSKNEITLKYLGTRDHGRLVVWMRKLGYQTKLATKKRPNMAQKTSIMTQAKRTAREQNTQQEPSADQWQKKIAELEKALEIEKIRTHAYSTMIDIAEEEFNIPIRKKLDTKP
jgi:transposase